MKEPTAEQIKEFWGWCGFRFKLSASENPHYWLDPLGKALPVLPPIDLNNLFKWAVPKLNESGLKLRMLGQKRDRKTFFCAIGSNNLPRMYKENKDPALVLFWAIWEVIEE